MADLEPGFKLKYLLEPNTQAVLRALCADNRDDLALSKSPQLKSLPTPLRFALLEQKKLRLKAQKKCQREVELYFTPLGLEQMTHWEIARYKASRYPKDIKSVADLCCGLGGDSFFLHQSMRVVGVDREPDALLAFKHNVSKYRSVDAVMADVSTLSIKADMVLLDPSRRAKGKTERWQEEDLSPSWDEIQKLIGHYGNMALKLGPGIQLPEFLQDYECQYLGLRDECLEALVLTGQLGRKGWVRAVELPAACSLEAMKTDIADSFGRVQSPGKFLFEPVKSVVRSHLFGVLAEQQGLWQIDARVAYLSGDQEIKHPLLKAYRILEELPFDLKVVKNFLKKFEVGRLEIKKRGVNLIPEEFRAGLKLVGPNEGTLIFTRVMDRKTVFWAKALA